MDRFLQSDLESLIALPDIGPKVAESIMQSLSDHNFHQEVRELLKLGVTPAPIKEGVQGPQKLKDMSFVVTGTLPIPRNEVQDIIRQAGGQVSSAISKKTSVLVAGENAGSKLEKAEKFGTAIWSWEDLQQNLK
jgi:DNA ligase (NAD+)